MRNEAHVRRMANERERERERERLLSKMTEE